MTWTPLVAGLLVMPTAGCLITSPPQFKAQQHTAPFLVEATALPDPRQVVIVNSANPGTITFRANVFSQDDPAGSSGAFQKVSSRLYIDYGVTPVGASTPYTYVFDGSTIDPGTLDQTDRWLSASWPTAFPPVSPGCHTATLVASHLFDTFPAECWSCSGDYSSITWQVLGCDMTVMGDCDALPVAGSAACASQLDSGDAGAPTCPSFQAQRDAGSSCPEGSDGGMQ